MLNSITSNARMQKSVKSFSAFVFDEDGKVLAESEHFGRSVEEARIKQKELAAFYERKFGF